MIVKQMKVPIKILKLEALIRRLHGAHPKIPQIKENLTTEQAGYRGEKSLHYYFQFLEQQEYLILQRIRLPNSYGFYFQMDTLILTPYFIFIVEIKNYAGTLFFDLDFHQLIRTINDKVDTFSCPILQVNRQETQLKSWLAKNKLPNIPVTSIVVISTPSTKITTDPKHVQTVKEKVIHAALFPSKTERQFNTNRIEVIPLKDLKKVAKLIIKQHTPLNPEILQQYQIDQSEIQTGVHCKKCNVLGMVRINGQWHCTRCKADNKSAHIEALQDYSLLISPTITNKQLRDFLQLNSTSIANKLLASLTLKHTGNKRGRVYELPTYDE